MLEKIIFAGFGGQGVMLMGKLIAHTAMCEGKYVVWMPSYGAEVRGGTAYSMVVISDKEIASPVVTVSDSCIVLNDPSYNKFKTQIKKKGLFIVNTSLITSKIRVKGVELLDFPVTDIAVALGSARVTNMVALGIYIAKKKIVKLENTFKSLKEIIPAHRKILLKINQQALKKGSELVK